MGAFSRGVLEVNQVQAFAKQFASDESFRRLALENPSAALSGFDLTAAERDSLTRMCRRVSNRGNLTGEVGPEEYWV